jgi:hypothetical protein
VAKFLFIYRNSRESMSTMSPEEMQAMLQKWNAWITEGLRQGWMLDGGDGLKKEGRVLKERKVITDGPFVEVKEMVGGYSVVQADTIDAAAEHAQGCPVFIRGGSVEVRELQEFGMGKGK